MSDADKPEEDAPEEEAVDDAAEETEGEAAAEASDPGDADAAGEEVTEAPAPRGEALVAIRNLKKRYVHMGKPLEVLNGIDLTIHQGEVVAIVGPSGAGKSTLLHCIGTLDLPSSGSLQLDGQELVGMTSAQLAAMRNQSIGFVFQFHHLLPEFNALENVMMPGLIQGGDRKKLTKRAMNLLEEVGLGDRASHRPGELSGGEQQRVALARALLLEPKLLLADEPTGNLDTATSDAMHKLFFETNKVHGTTIVVVTHNRAFAASMPRVVELVDGRVHADTSGPPSEGALARAVDDEEAEARRSARAGEFFERAIAKLVDTIVVGVMAVGGCVGAGLLLYRAPASSLSSVSSGPAFAPSALTLGALLAALLLAPFFYAVIAERVGGATLGKLSQGLVVRSERLRAPTLFGAIVRQLGMGLDTIFFGLVGYMAMAGSPRRQRLGDAMGGTVVVHNDSVRALGGRSPGFGAVLGLLAALLMWGAALGLAATVG